MKAVEESETEGKALLVCYSFPPIGGMSSLVAAHYARGLAQGGFQVDVLTIRPSAKHPVYRLDNSLDKLLPSVVRVFRTYPGLLYRASIMVWPAHRNGDSERHIGRRREGRYSRMLGSLYRRLLKPILIPDSRVDWLPSALSAARRLLRHEQYDVVFSYGYPFTAHLIAYLLRRERDFAWVAHQGDVWTFNPDAALLPRWRRCLDIKLERHLLKSTDKVIVNTDEMAAGYMEHFPFLSRQKVAIIDLGYDEKEYNELEPEKSPNFRLVYTGTFADRTREPYPLFDAIGRLSHTRQVEVIVAGNIAPHFRQYVADLRLERVITFLGPQPHDRVVALQKGGSVLLLLGVPGGYQVPAKILEYFAARRPILAVECDERDIAARRVVAHNRGVVSHNNSDSILAALEHLYQLWAQGTMESHFDLVAKTGQTWVQVEEQVKELFVDICSRKT